MYRKSILCSTVFLLIQRLCNGNPCVSVQTCGECIQNPECAWCSDEIVDDKCIYLKQNTTVDCTKGLITGKDVEEMEILRDDKLSSMEPKVQIRPQEISLKMTNNHYYTFKFDVARAWIPLDLYFLMDNSKTMEPHRQMLSGLVNNLNEMIGHLTGDFRMGFGTFVEKRVFPFQYHEDSEGCSFEYSFKNFVELTKDTEKFVEILNNTKTSCNQDTIENGLDALAQVLVCTSEIDWQLDRTRIVVLSTDEGFHVAGDGKFGGIVRPNDGKCHMSGGEYVDDLYMDYPSVSLIGHLMEESNTYVIFAIVCNETTKAKCEPYEELVEEVLPKNLAKFARLDLNSSTVQTIVNNTYNAILKSVNMTHDFPSEIDVNFNVLCHGIWTNSDSCTDVKVGETVEFEVTLHPRFAECKESTINTFLIQPNGIDETIDITLEIVCNCECELNGPQETNAEQCNYQGSLWCGVCECNEGFSGRNCMCSDNNTQLNYDNMCTNPSTGSMCSGSGHCICGVCHCERNTYGKYCECQDYNCPKKDGLLCSGADHGKCTCGECRCNRGWSRDDCSCLESTETCKPVYNKFICSNHGNCTCGTCKCVDGFFGTYCEACTVQDGSTACDECKELVKCVKDYHNITLTDKDASNIDCVAITNVSVTAESLKPSSVEWQRCAYKTSTWCTINYRFKKTDDGNLIMEIGPEECVFIASVGGLFSIIAGVVVTLLLMILGWKIVVTVNDKREFANFLEKRKYEKWHNDQNPIYKDPSLTYKNPLYNPEVN